MLERLMVRFRAIGLFKDPVSNEQHLLWLKHLDQTGDALRQDGDMLIEWIEEEINKCQFLSSKYRTEEDVVMYTKRLAALNRLRIHLKLLLTPGAL